MSTKEGYVDDIGVKKAEKTFKMHAQAVALP